VTAFPHDQKPDQEDRTIDIDSETHPYLSLIVWATVATPPGLPATVMPVAGRRLGFPLARRSSAHCSRTVPRLPSLNCSKGSTGDLHGRPKSRFNLPHESQTALRGTQERRGADRRPTDRLRRQDKSGSPLRERSSDHGVEKRTAAHAGRLKRKNGGFWSAQFCTEVAHPTRFERVTAA
jgi:hypothetical protein